MSDLLQIENLDVSLRRGRARVLRSVSLSVGAGQVHGLVGESGAGKSMIGKAILDVLPRSLRIDGGRIGLDGTDLRTLTDRERRRVIGASTALIPQDPLTALNPSRKIGGQITDRLVRLGWTAEKARARAAEVLDEVQIREPARVMQSYPHELSGGMRQRVLIGAAFAAEPALIVADEPTTALDVTVQKQILKMIKALQQQHGTTMLFVTHDLGVVARICQSVTVLHSGMVMEEAPIGQLLTAPQHPYTRALFAATPRHTEPDAALEPVPEHVLTEVRAQIDAADAAWSAR